MEEKKEDVQEQAPQIKLSHDPEWIALLQLTQELIPLKFRSDQCFDQLFTGMELPKLVTERVAKNSHTTADLEVKYDEKLVHSAYERLNPQTAEFIKKFNLDERLFATRQNNQFQRNKEEMIGNKRTFNQSFVSSASDKPVQFQRTTEMN